MMALAPIIMAVGLLPHVIGTWSHQTFETKVLLIGAATYLVEVSLSSSSSRPSI